jgi:glycosyltransferase involved in cell wall biosynthesis
VPNLIEQKAVSLFVRSATNCWDALALALPVGRKYFQRNLKRRIHSEKQVDALIHFADPLGALPREESTAPQYLYTDTTWERWNKARLIRLSENMQSRLRNAEITAVRNMDHVFTVSQYLVSEYIQRYNVDAGSITPVGTGIGHSGSELAMQHRDYGSKRMLFVAKLSGKHFVRKGGKLLLDAFDVLRKQVPEATLVIVGNDTLQKQLKNITGLEVHGFVSKEKLEELYLASSLFVQPALDEPWGLVFLEALLYQLPIVGLARNAFPELSGNGRFGFACEEEDPQLLADLLEKALSNPSHLERMGREGRDFVKNNYTWDNVARNVLSVIS